MAYPTVEQKDVLVDLAVCYGQPSLVSIEVTTGAYGLMRATWGESHLGAVRTLLIRPDGSRLAWQTLIEEPT